MPRLMPRLRRCLIPVVLAVLSQTHTAHAISPEEFAALDPEEALRLPAVEALEVFGWQREEFLFVLENALIDLRYLYRPPTGKPSKALTEAIRTFQGEAGYPRTGVIRVGELMGLIQRSNEFWQAPVFPGPVVYAESEGSISIEGTWVSKGRAERDPIQSTSIRCLRAAQLCVAITAKLIMAAEDEGWFHATATDLTLHARDWTITQWNAERIDAEDRSSLCVVQRLSIDLKRQSALLRNEPQADERCRESAPEAVEYSLESGYEVAARYWEQRTSRAHQLRSKAFQELVKRVSKKPAER